MIRKDAMETIGVISSLTANNKQIALLNRSVHSAAVKTCRTSANEGLRRRVELFLREEYANKSWPSRCKTV